MKEVLSDAEALGHLRNRALASIAYGSKRLLFELIRISLSVFDFSGQFGTHTRENNLLPRCPLNWSHSSLRFTPFSGRLS